MMFEIWLKGLTGWTVFQSILAVASLDGQLATLSIMQRINRPSEQIPNVLNNMDPMSRWLILDQMLQVASKS